MHIYFLRTKPYVTNNAIFYYIIAMRMFFNQTSRSRAFDIKMLYKINIIHVNLNYLNYNENIKHQIKYSNKYKASYNNLRILMRPIFDFTTFHSCFERTIIYIGMSNQFIFFPHISQLVALYLSSTCMSSRLKLNWIFLVHTQSCSILIDTYV